MIPINKCMKQSIYQEPKKTWVSECTLDDGHAGICNHVLIPGQTDMGKYTFWEKVDYWWVAVVIMVLMAMVGTGSYLCLK